MVVAVLMFGQIKDLLPQADLNFFLLLFMVMQLLFYCVVLRNNYVTCPIRVRIFRTTYTHIFMQPFPEILQSRGLDPETWSMTRCLLPEKYLFTC